MSGTLDYVGCGFFGDSESASLDCAAHTHTAGKYAALTPTTSISIDEIEPLL